MGQPWHEIRHLEKDAGLVALSANFALYGDMSDRMASLVAGLGHRHEKRPNPDLHWFGVAMAGF